jgi:hypothetical protein
MLSFSPVLYITDSSRFKTRCCEAREIAKLLWKTNCLTVLRELLIEFNCSSLNICFAIKIHREYVLCLLSLCSVISFE